jgi:hypothetical protein
MQESKAKFKLTKKIKMSSNNVILDVTMNHINRRRHHLQG